MAVAILYRDELKEYDFGPGHPFRGDRYPIFCQFLKEHLPGNDNYRIIKADWATAAEAWQKTRQQARTSDEVFYTWLNEGRVWIRKGDQDRAAACLREALAIRPDSEMASQLLAESHSD